MQTGIVKLGKDTRGREGWKIYPPDDEPYTIWTAAKTVKVLDEATVLYAMALKRLAES